MKIKILLNLLFRHNNLSVFVFLSFVFFIFQIMTPCDSIASVTPQISAGGSHSVALRSDEEMFDQVHNLFLR